MNWLIPHQANIRIIGAMAKRLELPMERVIVTVQEHGNTSTASVPLALDVGVRDGRVKRGDLLLLEAFGGGFTWGSRTRPLLTQGGRRAALPHDPLHLVTSGVPPACSVVMERAGRLSAVPAA